MSLYKTTNICEVLYKPRGTVFDNNINLAVYLSREVHDMLMEK